MLEGLALMEELEDLMVVVMVQPLVLVQETSTGFRKAEEVVVQLILPTRLELCQV